MPKVLIKLHTHDSKCKYGIHKEPGGAFALELLAPQGMCLDAYFSVYPYCLSLMYGAEFKFMPDPNTITFQFPSPVGPIVMEARRVTLGDKKIKVIITVKEILKLNNKCADSCQCNMKIGQEFEFNHMGQCPEI
ncbi:MAG: hypothetical protein Q8R31_02920, partial [Candidatus Omnitrophota bacterium]|nr:hypothetical protein [Candidatus Omnitrophota bacterium]